MYKWKLTSVHLVLLLVSFWRMCLYLSAYSPHWTQAGIHFHSCSTARRHSGVNCRPRRSDLAGSCLCASRGIWAETRANSSLWKTVAGLNQRKRKESYGSAAALLCSCCASLRGGDCADTGRCALDSSGFAVRPHLRFLPERVPMRRGSGGAISLILTFPRNYFIRWDKVGVFSFDR